MYIGPYRIEDCAGMSVEAARAGADTRLKAGPEPAPATPYPLRRLARAFAAVGAAAVVYASALLAIAIDAAIIEF